MRRTGVAAILVLSWGCGVKHIRTLQEAQVVFDRAAATDNRERFTAEGGMVSAGSALADYRLAGQMLDSLLQKSRSDLERDKLFCTAVALKALSAWRLGDTNGALAAYQSGQVCVQSGGGDAPRDAAILRAVPGLIRIDQAKAMADNASDNDAASIRTLITEAGNELNAAAGLVPSDHPVRESLVLSQLAGLAVLVESTAKEKMTNADRADVSESVNKGAACWVPTYACRSGDTAERGRRLAYWNTLLGTVVAQPDCKTPPPCPR